MKLQKNCRKRERDSKGITLIALVITIIVLLILAAISIATLTGQNGVLRKAETAKTDTQRAEIIENARVDITAKQTENLGSLTEKELTEILTPKYGTLSEEGASVLDKTLTTSDYGFEIPVKEIWNGNFRIEDLKVPIKFEVDGTKEFSAMSGDTWDDFLRLDEKETGRVNYNNNWGIATVEVGGNQYVCVWAYMSNGESIAYPMVFNGERVKVTDEIIPDIVYSVEESLSSISGGHLEAECKYPKYGDV